jgi:hypothetical protein
MFENAALTSSDLEKIDLLEKSPAVKMRPWGDVENAMIGARVAYYDLIKNCGSDIAIEEARITYETLRWVMGQPPAHKTMQRI